MFRMHELLQSTTQRLTPSALVMLMLGLIVTAALFAGARYLEHDNAALEFERRAQARLEMVKNGVDDAVNVLTVVNHLFTVFEPVSREQFRSFTRPFLEQYPYIQAFNFHRIVSGAERVAYEQDIRRVHPNFTITELVGDRLMPAASRSAYRVVDYIEPLGGNEKALGFDADSYEFEIAAMKRAIDTGLPSATRMLRLVQESESQRGFIVLMPTYRYGAVLTDVETRRNAVTGDVAAIFRIGDLVDMILSTDRGVDRSEMDLALYTGTTMDAAALIYARGQASAAQSTGGKYNWLWYNWPEPVLQNFDVAGQTWTIKLSTQPVWFAHAHRGSISVLIAGLLLTLVAAAYLQSVSVRSLLIRQLIDERTAELQHTNALLVDDIAARERAEHALQLRERAIESSANAILIVAATSPDYPIEYVNPAFELITGYAAADVIGQAFRFLQNDYRDQPGVEEIRNALREQRPGHAILRSYRKDGTLFWNDIYLAPVKDAVGGVSHFVVTQYDITATKRYEAELEYQANRDMLTGLANRNLLRDRLSQEIVYAGRYGHAVWVVYADLDRFKFINDTLGHKAGDTLLNKVAERLLIAVRETDTVARLGGDEFVLILPERIDERLSMNAVQRIMEILAQPLNIEGHAFFPTCSTGVAMYPTDGQDADTLIKHAEIAMYRVKETGRNNFQFYTPSMNAEALARLQIEGSLRNAIERDEFILHYQPQVDLKSGRIVGAEALIRWQHPDMGMVQPARFISLAEETGLIVPIGEWVIHTACRQAKTWHNAGLGQLRIAVNLSARQFYQHDLVKTVAAALQNSALAAKYLEIELTESLVMTDVERAIAILRDLKTLGVHISIDDFGTGYSSLSYLKRFPIDVLKIDQSFVRDITDDADDAAIVTSIISLAHSLRLKVIAEGVETAEQLAYLREHDCDQIQGYYFSKPLPLDALGLLLEQHAPTEVLTAWMA